MLDMSTLQNICPKCATDFVQARSNQRYCSSRCAKAATRNATRGPRTVAESAQEARRQEQRSGQLLSLSNTFFETHPRYRAAFLVDLIAEARSKAELRGWLTRREALTPWQNHKGTGRLHIAQLLPSAWTISAKRSIGGGPTRCWTQRTLFPPKLELPSPQSTSVRERHPSTTADTSRGDLALGLVVTRTALPAFPSRRSLRPMTGARSGAQ
jgi:hypothetical protein